MKLKTVTLRRYKSVARLEAFALRNLNVLIVANGADDNFNIDDWTSRQSFNREGKQ